jgi:hypothetical protein
LFLLLLFDDRMTRIRSSYFWNLDPKPDPYLVLTDPDPGGPKTYGSGSATLPRNMTFLFLFLVCLRIMIHDILYVLLVRMNDLNFLDLQKLICSVPDPNPDPPDPRVFGPPGSISQRYGSGSGSCSGSGSFYYQANIVRKTLISTVW